MNVGKDTQSPKRILPNDYLFLSGITKSIDEGTYTCVATSPPGGVLDEDGNPAKAEASIQLTVVRKSFTQILTSSDVLVFLCIEKNVALGIRSLPLILRGQSFVAPFV